MNIETRLAVWIVIPPPILCTLWHRLKLGLLLASRWHRETLLFFIYNCCLFNNTDYYVKVLV